MKIYLCEYKEIIYVKICLITYKFVLTEYGFCD